MNNDQDISKKKDVSKINMIENKDYDINKVNLNFNPIQTFSDSNSSKNDNLNKEHEDDVVERLDSEERDKVMDEISPKSNKNTKQENANILLKMNDKEDAPKIYKKTQNIEAKSRDNNTTIKEIENKEVVIIGRLKQLKCTILEFGTRPVRMRYFFCKCDSNLMEVICEHCAVNCHKGKDHSLINNEQEEYKVCQCGLKNHKLQESNSSYINKCMYHELSITSMNYVYYKGNKNSILCMFCNNFCREKELYREEIFTKKFHKEGALNFPECGCKNPEHGLEKFAPETWSRLVDKKMIFDFNQMKPAQILNSIFLSKKSFANSFHAFIDYFNTLSKSIVLKNSHETDFDKNLHLTNYFRCLKAIANFSSITVFWYFTPIMKTFFPHEILSNFLEKWVSDSTSSWNFLNYYLLAYKKINVMSYFNTFPKFKINDLQNFSSFQRTQIFLNIHSSPEMKEFKSKYIDIENSLVLVLINGIDSILKTRFTLIEALDCIINITSLLKILAQVYLFNNEQMLKFCSVVNKLFFTLIEIKKKTSKHSRTINQIKEKEIAILSNIIKTMICFPNIYNDFVIFNYLVKNKKAKTSVEDLKEIKFVNSYNEIGKAIAKNTINIIYYVTKDSNKIQKNVRKIINYASQIIAIFLREQDYFTVGLQRDLELGITRHLKLIFKEFNIKEISALNFLENQNTRILKAYEAMILCQVTKQDTYAVIKESVENVVRFLGLSDEKDKMLQSLQEDYSRSNSKVHSHHPSIDNPNSNLLKKEFGNEKVNVKSDLFNSGKGSKPNTFNENDMSSSHKLLLNKTQILHTIIKSLFLLSSEISSTNVSTDENIINLNENENYDKIVNREGQNNSNSILENMSERNSEEIDNDAKDKVGLRDINEINTNNNKNLSDSQSITKTLRTKLNKNSTCIDNNTNVIYNEDFIDNIFKILHFYVTDDVSNSLIGGSVTYLSMLKKIPEKYCLKFFDFCDLVYSTLINNEIEVTQTVKYIKEIKSYFNLISETNPKRYECLHLLLRLLYNIMMNLKSKNFMSCVLIVRKIMIELFNEFDLFTEYKLFLIKKANILYEKEQDEYNRVNNTTSKDISNIDNNNNPNQKSNFNILNELNLMNNNNSYNHNSFATPNQNHNLTNTNLNFNPKNSRQSSININFEFTSQNKNCNISSTLAETIFIKFIRMLNLVFDDNATFHNGEFLEEVLDETDIKEILKNKISLNLELRTELIKFYRMIYIDVSIIDRRLANYRLAFISVPEQEDNENLISNQNADIFNFLDNIISISQADNSSSTNNKKNKEKNKEKEKDPDFELLMSELKNFRLITECTGKDPKAVLYYYEQALFLPIKIYMNKFFSQARKKKGPEILKIYEMVIHCLILKYFMIENNVVSKAFDKVDDNSSNKMASIGLNIGSNSERNYEKDIYNKSLIETDITTIEDFLPSKENSIIMHNKFNTSSARKIEETMQEMTDTKFKLYDYVNLYKIASSHFLSCIKEHASHEMQDYEIVKPESYESILEKIDELELLTKINDKNNKTKVSALNVNKVSINKFPLEQISKKLFALCLIYEKEKRDISESSIITVLREVQIQYDLTLRNILLRYLFTVASDDDYEISIVSKNAYFIIFKLLQHDTENTQKEIQTIVNTSPGIINFDLLADTFFKNVLSVFLSAYNPTGIELKDDYETAYNIVKIFKMMSESSFHMIQGIVLRYLRFDYGDNTTKITFFDFLLVIVMKMLTLSRWDRNSTEETEKSAYLYEIFAAIMELLIEVVQGNLPENLQSLLDHEEQDVLTDEKTGKTTKNLISIKDSVNVNFTETPTNKNRVSLMSGKSLKKISNKQKDNKENNHNFVIYQKICVLPQFIIFIQTLLFDDRSDNEMIYKVRKQMFDFYLAFLEDHNCPLQIKELIIENINLTKVITSLKHTVKKFYIKSTAVLETGEDNSSIMGVLKSLNLISKLEKEEKLAQAQYQPGTPKNLLKNKTQNFKFSGLNTEKKHTDNVKLLRNQSDSAFVKKPIDFVGVEYDKNYQMNFGGLSPNSKKFFGKKLTENTQKRFKYEGEVYLESDLKTLHSKIKINEKIYNYYQKNFYSNSEFNSSIELEFCCLLFRYIKLLEINFNNSELNYFLSKYTLEKEDSIMKNYSNKTKNQVYMKPQGLVNNNMTIDFDEHYENLLMLKFFNSITKIVEVERDPMIIKVVFTINPEFSLVTKESKESFLESIPRNNRFSKLTYLVNNSIYFVNEIEYFKKIKKSWLVQLGNWIDYNKVIAFVFFFTCIVNIIMLAVLDGTFKMAVLHKEPIVKDIFDFRRRLNNDTVVDSFPDKIDASANRFNTFNDNGNEMFFNQKYNATYQYYNDILHNNNTNKDKFANQRVKNLFKSKTTNINININNTDLEYSNFSNFTNVNNFKRHLQIGKDYSKFNITNVTNFGVNPESEEKWLPIYGGISLAMTGLLFIVAIIWTLVKLPLLYHNKKCYLKVVKKIDIEKSRIYKYYVLITHVFLDSSFILTFLVYSIFSLIGYFNKASWWFAFNLLIITNISETIKNVFKALAMRWRNLLYAFIFQLTVMYAYTNITFYYFNELMVTTIDGEPYFLCESLVGCALLVFDFGLRRHSGLGEIIPKASFVYETPIYMAKFFFEASYYIVVTVMIMNIVFGILIDTFRELRINSKEIEHEKENVCLICGTKKEDLERNKISFYKHVNYNHDVWNYIQYMIKITNSNPQELTSINYYAYQMVNSKLIHWFPSTCFEFKESSVQSKEVSEEVEENQTLENLHTQSTMTI